MSRASFCGALFALLAPFLCVPAVAQDRTGWGADSLISVTPGTGAGYGAAYVPSNVLGLPDTTGRGDVAAIDPRQILSLGLGGEIVLMFKHHPIIDGPGPDFTVFENAFYYTIGANERIYAEPGEISVSADGVHFVPFPFDSLTLRGCAGVTPTNGDRDPADPSVSGGDSFDLRDVGMDTVRYVRIRDVTSVIINNPQSPFRDPTLNGFDLDAVVAVNGVGLERTAAVAAVQAPAAPALADISPNPMRSSGELRVRMERAGRIRILMNGVLGERVRTLVDEEVEAGSYRYSFDANGLANGAYFIMLEEDGVPRGARRVVIAR